MKPLSTRAKMSATLNFLPENRLGDYLFRLVHFCAIHRRLPRRSSWLLNDVLFYILTTNEITQPDRIYVTDKEFLKLFVNARIGGEFNVPTLAVLRSGAEIREYRFPKSCVIKPTHLSQHVFRRIGGSPVPLAEIESWFSMNFYQAQRERNYRSLVPKVIVEPFVFDQHDPFDYKFYCVAGEPRLVGVHSDRRTGHRRTFFDAAGNRQPFWSRHPPDPAVTLPDNFARMFEVAGALSRGFTFMRVDLYSDGGRIAVGEMTNAPTASNAVFQPETGERQASAIIWPDRHARSPK